MPTENWLPVMGFEALYEVSDLGNVRRIARGPGTYIGKVLAPRPLPSGYLQVNLSCRSKAVNRYIHHLVMDAFVGHQQVGIGKTSIQVNHKDGNKKNNRFSNLEYIGRRAHHDHGIANGLTPRAERNARAKLNTTQVLEIRELLKTMNRAKIAGMYGVSTSTIQYIDMRWTWKHI